MSSRVQHFNQGIRGGGEVGKFNIINAWNPRYGNDGAHFESELLYASVQERHMSYAELITEAIIHLKLDNGASRLTIKSFILQNHPNLQSDILDAAISRALRLGVADGRFIQVKQAFRLGKKITEKSIPLKKWIFQVLREKDNLKFREILDKIVSEHKIDNVALLERAVKAVLNRGVHTKELSVDSDGTYSLNTIESDEISLHELEKFHLS